MTRPIRIAGLSALLALAGAPTLEMASDPGVVARARLESMVRAGEIPGIQYLVVTGDTIHFQDSRGVRDVSTGEPMQGSTLQMAYSTTKVITAIAAMQLVEAGRLELDRPLDAYFAAHPYGGGVTIRRLLAQTSGVPNPMPLDWFSVGGDALDREEKLRETLAKHPKLHHRPGSKYGYSNLSYWLLEKVIEAASGQDYADYVADHVFAPLSVGRGEALFEPGARDEMATGHARRYGVTNLVLSLLAPSEYWVEPHGRWSRVAALRPHGRAYGGLFTSASALAAVLQDLLRDDPVLMARETRDTMFARQRTVDGEPTDMALGWVIGELAGARYLGKQGGGLGFHGNVRVYPELGVATVLLANRTEISADPIDARSDVLDAAFVRALRAPAPRPAQGLASTP